MTNDKALVIIPTYNEEGNIREMCRRILKLGLNGDILFIDDNSPDGTGKILDELCRQYPGVKALHRPGKSGIGSAHREGIKWAYTMGYKTVVTMDCDFSHSPEYISDLIQNAQECDLVVGSRYLRKDSLKDWSVFRKVLTRTGHFLTKTLLRIDFDATNAFRLYRLNQIPEKIFEMVRSNGYSFFFESLFVLHLNGFVVKEVPIDLPARTYGHSKMRYREVIRSVKLLLLLFSMKLFAGRRFRAAYSLSCSDDDFAGNSAQDWDVYWDKKKSTGGAFYGVVAAFYRKCILRRVVNYFIRKTFPPGARLLHAGCGSGQVDTDIQNYASIVPLDISRKALDFYRKVHGNHCNPVHGDIFNIPAPDEAFDGVYNLGVMEHFSEAEITGILLEFHRVLKPGGKLIFFWPPEFGLSVIFLKILKFILQNILGKKVQFHPEEKTRIKSKEHAMMLLDNKQFSVREYYFGIRDFFTHAIIIAQKVNDTA